MTASRLLRRALNEGIINATAGMAASDPTYEDDAFQDSNSTYSDITPNTAFDAPVFWGVNAFLLVLLVGLCVWCVWCGGKDHVESYLSANRRADSDREYQATLRQRQEARLEARRSTPTKRRARLQRSFVRNHVQMVRTS